MPSIITSHIRKVSTSGSGAGAAGGAPAMAIPGMDIPGMSAMGAGCGGGAIAPIRWPSQNR